MKQMQVLSVVLALSAAGAVWAQNQPQTAQPSTSPTEGTAADQTPPGQTPTQGTTSTPSTVDPTPSTNPAEGTAADSTPPPGQTATGSSARMAGAGSATRQASKMIGMKVQTPAGKNIGAVKDLVIDSSGSVSDLIVDRQQSSGGKSRLVSLPWSEARSMIREDALVLDQAKLDQAQSFDESSRY
jgi:sporulation protein YlmC with PRC-barrel domain